MGLIWGLLAALGYAATNLCMRVVAVQVDPLVAALVRVVPMVLMAWGLLVAQRQVGRLARLSWPALLPLVFIGFVFHVTGNGAFQAGLVLTGLTVTAPIATGALLWGGVLVAGRLLGERVSARAALGLVLLVAGLPLLMAGAGGGTGPAWLGALAAALAGLSYGGGNSLLRHTMLVHRLSQATAIAPLTLAGGLSLLGLVLARQGADAFARLDGPTVGWLLLGGCFNAGAFLALARSLALLPVARANALTTLQTALSALGGVLLFGEPLTAGVAAGLLLTLGGAVLSQQGRPSRPVAPRA